MISKKRRFTKVRRLGAVSALAIAVALSGPSAAQNAAKAFDIPAQPLAQALADFSRQSDLIVVAPTQITAGKTSNSVNGDMPPAQALERLLGDAGLNYTMEEDGSIMLRLASADAAAIEDDGRVRLAQVETGATDADDLAEGEPPRQTPDEMVVTGTSIRGVYPHAVPLETFDAAEIEAMGVVSMEDLLSRIPQNLNNFNTTAPFALGSGAARSKINLRGLGVGASLLLINGRRVVSPGGVGADISLLPLGAVERVEVLSDGASAVYGSDAIGGVMNVILKDDTNGATTSLSYGTVTEGGHHRVRVDHTIGDSWDSGSFLAGYSFADTTGLDASDRDFASGAGIPHTLAPQSRSQSGMLSLNQSLGERVKLEGDVLYSNYESDNSVLRQSFGGQLWRVFEESEQVFANAGATITLNDKLNLELVGAYSEYWREGGFEIDGLLSCCTDANSSYLDLSGRFDGDLFELPAGAIKFSIGGSYADEKYFLVSTTTSSEASRTNSAIFGELFIPLVSGENAMPGFEVLELSLAARYSDYSDFSGKTTPRFGLFWKPIKGVGLRGTYSQGFRAPPTAVLADATGGFVALFSPATLGSPDIFSDDNSTVYLFRNAGRNPNLMPETSESYTLGIDFEPAFLPGARFSVTYYNIDYTDRIASPDPVAQSLLDPASFPSVFTINPSIELIAELIDSPTSVFNLTTADITDPASVASVATVALDLRTTNVSKSHVEGIDFVIDYTTDTSFGDLSFGSSLTYAISSTDQVAPGSPITDSLNDVGRQPDFRGRAFVSLARGGFNGQVNLRYVDGYPNTFVTPEARVGSWTTFDVTASYDFGDQQHWALNNLVLSFSATNLFDQDPPFVDEADAGGLGLNESIGFDPANASAVGRFVQFGIKKTF